MLLLDLDRTLVDVQSFTDYDAAWADVQEMLEDADTDPHRGPQTGWTSATRACMATIGRLTDVPLWRVVSGTIERHERAAIEASRPMPGVEDFWRATADRPRAVVTLLPEGVAREVLEHHGLDAPAVVVGRDPLVRPKPSGDGLRLARRRLGEEYGVAATVMVGDSAWDALAARDAGVDFIGVHTPPGEYADWPTPPPTAASLAEVLALLKR